MHRLTIVVFILILMLAGCGGEQGYVPPTITPRPAISSTPRPPATSALADATSALADDNASSAPMVGSDASTPIEYVRMTLPPTWTPAPTETPLPTRDRETSVAIEAEMTVDPEATGELIPTDEVIVGTFTPVFAPTVSPSCATFMVDGSLITRTIRQGEAPRIAWTPVEEAVLYRVVAINNREEELYNELVEETALELPASAFNELGFYGWLVTPLDAIGLAICEPVGETFNVMR